MFIKSSKASELIGENVPEDEVDEYMNKNFYNKLNKETTDKLLKGFNLKVLTKEEVEKLQKELSQEIGRYEKVISETTNNRIYGDISKKINELNDLRKEYAMALNRAYSNDLLVFDKNNRYLHKEVIKDIPLLGYKETELETYRAIMNGSRELVNEIKYDELPETDGENKYYLRDYDNEFFYFKTKEELDNKLKELYGQEDPKEFYRVIKQDYNDAELDIRKEQQKYIQQRIEEQKEI